MKKLSETPERRFELDPRKIWWRAIVAQNKEFENVDWSEIKFKVNRTTSANFISLSLRPKTRTKYNEGCGFLYRKMHINDYLDQQNPEMKNRININGWSKKLNLKQTIQQCARYVLGLPVDQKEIGGLVAELNPSDVEWMSDSDLQLNVYFARGAKDESPLNVVGEKETFTLSALQKLYFFIDAGENHPIFRGRAIFRLTGTPI